MHTTAIKAMAGKASKPRSVQSRNRCGRWVLGELSTRGRLELFGSPVGLHPMSPEPVADSALGVGYAPRETLAARSTALRTLGRRYRENGFANGPDRSD